MAPLALCVMWVGTVSLQAGQGGVAGQAGVDAATIARRVDDHYNHLRSLRARYTEHYAGLGMDRTESGTLLLKKPGRMRWTYDTPVGKVFVLDGKFAWSYAPGDSQAQRVSAKQMDDLRSPLRFLLGHTRIEKELDGLVMTPVAGGYQISGVPKGMGQRVRSMEIEVSREGVIGRIRIEEIDGAVTEFHFTGIEENAPVKDGEFVFTPPPGVSVVDGLPPV